MEDGVKWSLWALLFLCPSSDIPDTFSFPINETKKILANTLRILGQKNKYAGGGSFVTTTIPRALRIYYEKISKNSGNRVLPDRRADKELPKR